MAERPEENKRYSRRQFLKGFPMGIAGAYFAGTLSDRLLSGSAEKKSKFPFFREGSIFKPSRRRYPDS